MASPAAASSSLTRTTIRAASTESTTPPRSATTVTPESIATEVRRLPEPADGRPSTDSKESALQAARAAHLQGKDERRDEWLRMAFQDAPEAANAVLLTQAEFQLDREQYEQALATLRRIEENSKDHSHALALLARLGEALQTLADALGRRLGERGRHYFGTRAKDGQRVPGVFASAWPIGTTALWIAVLLMAYVLVYYL